MDKITTLCWSDRHIRITGFDPLTGQLISVPSYKSDEVYPILVTVDKYYIIPSENLSLSGASRCEVTVQDAPGFSPFQKNDHIVIVGAPDGTSMRNRNAPMTAPTARSGTERCLLTMTPPMSREASATVTIPLPMFTS